MGIARVDCSAASSADDEHDVAPDDVGAEEGDEDDGGGMAAAHVPRRMWKDYAPDMEVGEAPRALRAAEVGILRGNIPTNPIQDTVDDGESGPVADARLVVDGKCWDRQRRWLQRVVPAFPPRSNCPSIPIQPRHFRRWRHRRGSQSQLRLFLLPCALLSSRPWSLPA